MALPTYPTMWSDVMGANASYTTISETTASTGRVSLFNLFPAETSLDIKEGGVAPSRVDMNGLFRIIGDNIFYLQRGGVYNYSSEYDYYAGSIVTDGGRLYVALEQSGPNVGGAQAITDTTYWKDLSGDASVSEATLTTAGIVQLSNELSSSQTTAVTPYAVQTALDEAVSEITSNISDVSELSDTLSSFQNVIDNTIVGIYQGNMVFTGYDEGKQEIMDALADTEVSLHTGQVWLYDNKLWTLEEGTEDYDGTWSDVPNYGPAGTMMNWNQFPLISSSTSLNDSTMYASSAAVYSLNNTLTSLRSTVSSLQTTVSNLESRVSALGG